MIRTKQTARAYRAKLDGLIGTAPDEAALAAIEVFPAWRASGEYSTGDRVRQNGGLYRCLQAHKAQADWSPGAAASLWAAVADPAIEWPDWVQPEGAHDAHPLGKKVTHKGKRWISTVDNNTWEPGVYGWEEQN